MKVKILQNSEVKAEREVGEMIAHRAEAIFVDSIGKILIFFKPDNKKGKITKEFNEFKRKGKNRKMTSGIIFGNRLLDVAAISCFLASVLQSFLAASQRGEDTVEKAVSDRRNAEFACFDSCFTFYRRIYAERAFLNRICHIYGLYGNNPVRCNRYMETGRKTCKSLEYPCRQY